MGRGREEMLDEISFVFLRRALSRRHADDAFATAPLRAERAHRRALDEAAVRDANDRSFVGDEILHVDLAFVGHQLGQTRAGVFLLNLAQLLLDDLENT